MFTYQKFEQLINSFENDIKPSHDITKILHANSPYEIAKFTEELGGLFLLSHEVNERKNIELMDRISYPFYIISSYDIREDKVLYRYRKTLP